MCLTPISLITNYLPGNDSVTYLRCFGTIMPQLYFISSISWLFGTGTVFSCPYAIMSQVSCLIKNHRFLSISFNFVNWSCHITLKQLTFNNPPLVSISSFICFQNILSPLAWVNLGNQFVFLMHFCSFGVQVRGINPENQNCKNDVILSFS